MSKLTTVVSSILFFLIMLCGSGIVSMEGEIQWVCCIGFIASGLLIVIISNIACAE